MLIPNCIFALSLLYRLSGVVKQIKRLSALVLVVGFTVAANAAPPFHIHLVGDSTMSDKRVTPPYPERGWGQLLPLYMQDPTMIENHAINGRSTKSYILEGSWKKVLAALRPGDWVIIQFGHNDGNKKSPERYADPHSEYPDNLRRMVKEVRAAGANPILATPIIQRQFDEHGKILDTHGAYPNAVRRVATEEAVPLLELYGLTRELVASYGEENSKKLFLHIAPGEYEDLPQGRTDNTHLSAIGASRVAELAAAEFRRLKLPLAEWLK